MGFRVGDEFRENPLHLRGGGKTIVVVMKDHMPEPRVCEYDNVQYPFGYIRTAMRNPDVKTAYVKKDN